MIKIESFVYGFLVCAAFGLSGYAMTLSNLYLGYFLLPFSYIISLPAAIIVWALTAHAGAILMKGKYYAVGAIIGTILNFGLLFLYALSAIGSNPA